MDCLDLVPSLRRHIRQFILPEDTDSKLAGYVSDGVKALAYRWHRSYTVTSPSPNSYIITPDITQVDEHPIMLASAIIYKGGLLLGSFNDEGFAFNIPTTGVGSAIQRDVDELKLILPPTQLAGASTAPLRGYDNIFNPEGYNFLGILLDTQYY